MSENTRPVVQTTAEKAQHAKEAVAAAGHKSIEYTGEKVVQAKDTTVSYTKTVAGYVGEEAVVAKDVAFQIGKTAAGYTGKVVEEAKDRVVVVGWVAAHYTTEAAVEATKMAGGYVKTLVRLKCIGLRKPSGQILHKLEVVKFKTTALALLLFSS
ncbi:seed biotin-containing protein SBP65-like [Spinacia oleracea]|uniref:Seed biotin-containing protein SBP65-like n=1 Tax=Spinacia oleracea TaxID=3562 RepID=A0A9R0JSX2_SPIOL|nr:seed biotin-containing protein SBP65-like [Spinacia oleracea]XP_021845371.1 seed biotin-containing protein SBP65-like [Spinacia oleracea]